MTQDEAIKWLYRELEKLSKEDYVDTYMTCVELRPSDACDGKVEYVILPVDTYEKFDTGYEIMPVEVLAAHCKWDMKKTNVRVNTEHTHIDNNLYDIIDEDVEIHRHLKQLKEPDSTLQDEIDKLQKEIEALKKTSQIPYKQLTDSDGAELIIEG